MNAPASGQRLVRRLATDGVRWLHHNRHRGSFPAETTADLGDPNEVYKPLGESCLAAEFVLRVPGPLAASQTQATELLEHAWEQMRHGDLLYERQVRHQLATDPLECYAHFVPAGYRHQRLHSLLAHLTASTSWWAVEVLPNRRLAVVNAARLVGFPHPENWRPLVDATWLGQLPEPWLIDWITAYAVTHTVYHVTDWGRRPHALPTPISDYLTRWLPAWMRVWAEVGDWDLLGELLLVDACLPHPQLHWDMYRLLADAQHPDGMVPHDTRPVSEDAQEAFTDHQHTTAVTVMAAALALARSDDARSGA
ncbi:DUF6895 family protein [Streptomyces sp. NPDC003730]